MLLVTVAGPPAIAEQGSCSHGCVPRSISCRGAVAVPGVTAVTCRYTRSGLCTVVHPEIRAEEVNAKPARLSRVCKDFRLREDTLCNLSPLYECLTLRAKCCREFRGNVLDLLYVEVECVENCISLVRRNVCNIDQVLCSREDTDTCRSFGRKHI